jgi:hypothetical protein
MDNFPELIETGKYFQECKNLRKIQSVMKLTKGFIIEQNL